MATSKYELGSIHSSSHGMVEIIRRNAENSKGETREDHVEIKFLATGRTRTIRECAIIRATEQGRSEYNHASHLVNEAHMYFHEMGLHRIDQIKEYVDGLGVPAKKPEKCAATKEILALKLRLAGESVSYSLEQLGLVEMPSSSKELRKNKSVKKIVSQAHPDKNIGDEFATEKSLVVNKAYELIETMLKLNEDFAEQMAAMNGGARDFRNRKDRG